MEKPKYRKKTITLIKPEEKINEIIPFLKKSIIKGDQIFWICPLIEESKKIEKAGAFSLVLECVAEKTAKKITKLISIPTIGIGSSSFCDGQILVTDDILGMSNFYPKFVKRYSNINALIEKAVKKYCKEVKLNIFPSKKNFLYGK